MWKIWSFLILSSKKWVNPNNIITNDHCEPKLPTVEHFKPLSAWNCWVFFSVEACVISPVKIYKVREVHISPYCRLAIEQPNFTKFSIRVKLSDVITWVKFLVNRFRGYGVLTPQIALSHWLAVSPLQQCAHCRATLWLANGVYCCMWMDIWSSSFLSIKHIYTICFFVFLRLIPGTLNIVVSLG